MKLVVILVGVLCAMSGCTKDQKSSKGIVSETSATAVTIVTDQGDTLSFVTTNADQQSVQNLLPNDTLEVFYTGKYTPNMNASKLVQYPQMLIGGGMDKHGCMDSAGYVWSEVQQDCIRLFEKGIRAIAVNDTTQTAFIVFSPDSTKVELFFSNGKPNEILERRSLPAGGYAWNVEDDDTKNVLFDKGGWTISQRGNLVYSQKKK